MSADDRLAGLTIAVTGAAGGIGQACVARILAAGGAVVALDRAFPEDLGSLAAATRLTFDQGDPDALRATVAAMPKVDGLVNCAGLPPVAELGNATILRVNFYGLRLFTELLVDGPLAGGGAVVNLSSAAGGGPAAWAANRAVIAELLALTDFTAIAATAERLGVKDAGLDPMAAYPLSKQLVSAWTLQVGMPWKQRGVRINAISPSAVDTPLLGPCIDSFGAEVSQRLEKIGVSTPAEIAGVVAFLLSVDASRIVGTVLPVDGGAGALQATNALGLPALG